MWLSLRCLGSHLLDKVSTAPQIETLFDILDLALADATLAIIFFQDSRRAQQEAECGPAESHHDATSERLAALARDLAESTGEELTAAVESMLSVQMDRVATEIYVRRVPFLHARSFVFALDQIAKTFRVLVDMDGLPASANRNNLTAVLEEWNNVFPHLKGLRDTAHHVEDRVRGVGRNGKPLELKAVNAPGIQAAERTAIFIDMLDGDDVYSGTFANGEYGGVPVTLASLDVAVSCVRRFVGAFVWDEGSRRIR